MYNFNGLGMNMGNLNRLSRAKTRSISPENKEGAKGSGGMAEAGVCGNAPLELGRGWKCEPCIPVEPGQTVVIAEIKGPGAIQSIWIGGHVGRQLIIRIYWDEQEQPSVECPLSDFFACGWYESNENPTKKPFSQLNSLAVCVNPNKGMNCYWEMPFRKSCRITFENISKKIHHTFYQINYTLTDVPEDAGYFHAQFRRTNPVPYMQDYTILDGVSGLGHYVGTALQVGLNGANGWWGEGEIKFFIDGDDEFPTICGTGTEDYFCGSFDWDVEGKYTLFTTPYAGLHYIWQPDGLYTSQQRFSLYRWHIPDPIRFERDLKVTLQDLGWRSEGRFLPRQDDFASTAYWYQTLPTAPFPKFLTMNELEVC